MNKESYVIKGLLLEHRQIKDVLRILIHSILFQRELGIVIPRTVESDCGIHYLTLNDITTDKIIEEKLSLFQNRVSESLSCTLVLSFYQSVRKKTFFMFQENSKFVWEEWKIPIRLVNGESEDYRKCDTKMAKKVRKRLFAIIERICERKEHLPPMGEPDDPNVIRYPFEILAAADMGESYFAKGAPLVS